MRKAMAIVLSFMFVFSVTSVSFADAGSVTPDCPRKELECPI